jgi:hypothetical protein|tara:strand:+ start:343 stop:657 length:315 start_codon:yes stop_codon:yes gene_type:complete
MKVQLSNAIIEKVETRADRSYKVILGLPELSPQEAYELFSNLQTEVVQVEVELEEYEGKTPSKRLRAVYYRWWEQDFKTKYPEFEVFYAAKMEGLINQVKNKLN